MKTILITFISTFLMMFYVPFSVDQNFGLTSGSTLKVTGTSSLHDWEVEAKELYCDVAATMDDSNVKLESLSFKVKAKSFKSEKDLMDKKTYEALKADKYPDITFKSTTPVALPLSGDTFKGNITGTLTLAGKAKNITVAVTGKKKSANSIQLSGTKKIKMTEYGMEPPTALMGTIKTGDEVTVHFNINLNTK